VTDQQDKTEDVGVEQVGALRTLREMPTAARFVLLGVFINQFGAFLQAFMVLYLVARGFSSAQAGLALGGYSGGAIVGVLLGGAVADRLGSRWTIAVSMAFAALFTFALTVLSSLPVIVAVVALAGLTTQAARPAVAALLFGFVPAARQVMAFAIYRTVLNAGAAAGPLLAAWLSTISWNLVFYVDGATTLVYGAIAAVLLAPHRVAAQGGTDKPAKESTKSNFRTMVRDLHYVGYLGLQLANGLVHVQFFAVLPLMLYVAGYPTWAYGWTNAVAASLIIGSELLVTRRTQKWPTWIAVTSGWVLLVLGRGMLGLPGGLVIIFAGAVVAAAGQVIGGPAAFAYPAKIAPPGATARYVSGALAMFGLGYAIGPALGILLWNHIGNVFWALCTVFGLAMAVVGVWSMRPAPELAVVEVS
jgi:MFS family permease